MIARLTFLGITAFWITMNVLLWRMEFGPQHDDMPVPLALVWGKILTAPDASSLSIYQNNIRMGYCELATDVGQEMAKFDADKPPQEGAFSQTGGQVHLAGNMAVGDFTNRVKFDARVQFNPVREWQELTLKVTFHGTIVEFHSLATNQTVELKITGEGEPAITRTLAFADLKNPATVIHIFTGNLMDGLLGEMDFPALAAAPASPGPWVGRRTRLKIGAEFVPVYQLETRLLDRAITIDVSTLGEILQVDLPGNITARIDALSHP
jgi:hypothetical protein